MNADEIERVHDIFLEHGLDAWAKTLPQQYQRALAQGRHGDMDRWQAVLAQLPQVTAKQSRLTGDMVSTDDGAGQDAALTNATETLLKQLKPWRKGPYRLHGVHVDTEWRSDMKWRRLQPHIQSLAGRRVLDVGCGNGYHAWRMAGEGAQLVVGIDPTQLFWAQFQAVQHFIGTQYPVYFLPIGIEDVPPGLAAFDTVFSMGILYHRRSPLDHLLELKACLRPGGELVLETLVIDGKLGETLLPPGRYAKMRNTWFIPSPDTLQSWATRCGFRNARIVDVSTTTTDEQRTTPWMDFESLADFLDPQDPSRTLEGHPAPRRAILLADA